MERDAEKFLRYPSTRDTVFVFGAGTSNADGVPLQKDLLPMIISGEIAEIENSSIGKTVAGFIRDNFSFFPREQQYPQLEAVFGFLDYFIQQNESLNSKYTNSKIREIKEYLIKLIHYVVDMKTDSSSATYHAFWEAVKKYNPNISIITLNYDTLLEQAFEFLFKDFGYIDYRTPFMNYESLPELKPFNFWINPAEPVKISGDENPVPIKIIKVHGSLNWKYCNCCNQILLTPWDRKIDLNEGKFLGYTYPEKDVYEYVCPLDDTDFQTLIMPPSLLKPLSHPVLSQLLNEAGREIRICKRVVFIGYSLSDADIHIKALLRKHLGDDVEVFVVNHKESDKLKNKYLSISKNVKFIYLSFEELMQNPDILELLFSNK